MSDKWKELESLQEAVKEIEAALADNEVQWLQSALASAQSSLQRLADYAWPERV